MHSKQAIILGMAPLSPHFACPQGLRVKPLTLNIEVIPLTCSTSRTSAPRSGALRRLDRGCLLSAKPGSHADGAVSEAAYGGCRRLQRLLCGNLCTTDAGWVRLGDLPACGRGTGTMGSGFALVHTSVVPSQLNRGFHGSMFACKHGGHNMGTVDASSRAGCWGRGGRRLALKQDCR